MLGREDAIVGAGMAVVGGGAIVAATSTSETGPILAFVGALLVAVIAAYTADRRQERALEAERRRQQAGLRHEREQADVTDLRSVLEEALSVANDALNSVGVAFGAQVEARGLSGRSIGKMSAQLDRLHVRLGQGDPMVEAYVEMGVALMHLRNLTDEKTADDQVWDEARDRWAAAYHQ
jgi:hypothetical protein